MKTFSFLWVMVGIFVLISCGVQTPASRTMTCQEALSHLQACLDAYCENQDDAVCTMYRQGQGGS
jgi:hypothetical protein